VLCQRSDFEGTRGRGQRPGWARAAGSAPISNGPAHHIAIVMCWVSKSAISQQRASLAVTEGSDASLIQGTRCQTTSIAGCLARAPAPETGKPSDVLHEFASAAMYGPLQDTSRTAVRYLGAGGSGGPAFCFHGCSCLPCASLSNAGTHGRQLVQEQAPAGRQHRCHYQCHIERYAPYARSAGPNRWQRV
jgi:hypothetical protein